MRIEDYQLLLDLNDCKTIRSTAKKILISQPALTQRLKYIEDYLEGIIFLRTPKKLVLTPFGELVVSHAKQVVEKEAELRNRLSTAKGKVAGTLFIGASSLYSQHFLPQILQSFTKKYPEVTIDLVTGVSEEIRQSASSFHVCIVRGDPLKDYSSIHLLDDPLYLFDYTSLTFPSDRPFIEFKSDPDFQRLIESWVSVHKAIPFKRSIRVDHFETAKQMMKHGLGMTVLPASISEEERDLYPNVPLTLHGEPVVREAWACMKREVAELPQVAAFVSHLKEIKGKL
ncbi:LysR family transcriptional regulator [Halobacillus litoralis]|uniref:LysR family transcriptional regulator n=1 Tax=Halobacillus litoralis TaxID=45668 RepID=UPI001CFF435B|nr:LysR family transcriptional regulator [Halobacillus litoralis]